MADPKSATNDPGLGTPLPFPTLANNYNSLFDKVVVQSTCEGGQADLDLDLALIERSAPSLILRQVWDGFIDGYLLEATNKEGGEELPEHLAQLVKCVGITPVGHRLTVRGGPPAVRKLFAQGVALVATVLGDTSRLTYDQARRVHARLTSENWSMVREQLFGLVFGYHVQGTQARQATLDGVLLALIAHDESARNLVGVSPETASQPEGR